MEAGRGGGGRGLRQASGGGGGGASTRLTGSASPLSSQLPGSRCFAPFQLPLGRWIQLPKAHHRRPHLRDRGSPRTPGGRSDFPFAGSGRTDRVLERTISQKARVGAPDAERGHAGAGAPSGGRGEEPPLVVRPAARPFSRRDRLDRLVLGQEAAESGKCWILRESRAPQPLRRPQRGQSPTVNTSGGLDPRRHDWSRSKGQNTCRGDGPSFWLFSANSMDLYRPRRPLGCAPGRTTVAFDSVRLPGGLDPFDEGDPLALGKQPHPRNPAAVRSSTAIGRRRRPPAGR